MLRCDVLQPVNPKLGQAQVFNLNQSGETRVYDVGPYSVCSVQASGDASWGTAVLTIKRSNDLRHPVNLESVTTLTAAGMTPALDCSGFRYLHVTLSTLEGAADTCELTVIGKDDSP
jgi:hypothetical protein